MKFRSRLTVHFPHLAFNFNLVKKVSPQSQILFMVKADAYGHGMIPIVRYAFLELGIREFGCATIAEAVKLRGELAGLPFDIYVFSDTQLEIAGNADLYSKFRIIPVISNVFDLDLFLHGPEFKHLPLCLKFNTGMNRLGFDFEETPLVVQKLKFHGRNSVHHLCTHFANANAGMECDEKNILQRNRFVEIKKFFRDSGIILERTSKANSGAIEQGVGLNKGKSGDDTHLRPGLMIYGPSSLNLGVVSIMPCPMKLVSRLETTVLRAWAVKKGETFGYNSTPCPRDGVLVIIAIGYGDGFFNRYAGAHILHNGFKGQIIGRVSMDMTHVLFPMEAYGKIEASQIVSVWGWRDGDLDEFSEETKIIPYEIFCSLLPRISRFYRLK